MRLDQKFFVPFLLICAALTATVIFLSSLNYVSNQHERFIEEIEETDMGEWKFYHYESGDSVSFSQFEGAPVVVHFWSTWSDLSLELNSTMNTLQSELSDLVVVAAASRDAENLVKEHIQSSEFEFVYLDGTPLYQELMVPGLPSQLFIDRSGRIVDEHVGKDVEAIRSKARQLVNR